MLQGVISENQSAFVPSRLITDNIMIAYEIIHCIRKKREGKVSMVVLKLDMAKAYDRFEWGYVEVVMRSMGFGEKWISWVILCVRTVKFHVLFDGNLVGPIVPQRGLRQGGPLSPYLFLLCVEGMSALI